MSIKRLSTAVPVAMLAALAAFPLHADEIADAVSGSKWNLDFRYRFEFVDDDFFVEDAKASTLRTRLNLKTGGWNGWSAFVEFDYVTDIYWDDYNAGGGNTPGKEMYPTVADPTGTDFNQGYIQYAWGEKSHGRAGRQRIIYDNARFVGNVGWRQNEQTYDSASIRHNAGGFDLQYAYLWNVNRIFGDEVNAGDHEQATNLFNAAYKFDGTGKLTGYLYDIDNEDLASFSTSTFGVRWTGNSGGSPFGYSLEWATQSDAHDNPVNYDADYWRADFSWAFSGATPYAGFESLGGSSTQSGAAFRTPLATLHAFNGWADKFLTTPDEGLEDMFIGVKGKFGAWSWNVVYHDFSAEATSDDWGTEIDASLSRKFADRYGLLFKLASFDSDSPRYSDTTKAWVQFTAGFGS